MRSAFYPLYLHSRCFGCNLFNLPKSNKVATVSIKMTDMLILFVHVVIYGWLFVSVNFSESENDKTLRRLLFHLTEGAGSLIMAFIGRVLFYSFAVTNVFICVMDIVNRNRIWKVLSEMRRFDAKVGVELFLFFPLTTSVTDEKAWSTEQQIRNSKFIYCVCGYYCNYLHYQCWRQLSNLQIPKNGRNQRHTSLLCGCTTVRRQLRILANNFHIFPSQHLGTLSKNQSNC